eukprot:1399113-Rhodomonas_salina.2
MALLACNIARDLCNAAVCLCNVQHKLQYFKGSNQGVKVTANCAKSQSYRPFAKRRPRLPQPPDSAAQGSMWKNHSGAAGLGLCLLVCAVLVVVDQGRREENGGIEVKDTHAVRVTAVCCVVRLSFRLFYCVELGIRRRLRGSRLRASLSLVLACRLFQMQHNCFPCFHMLQLSGCCFAAK